MPDEHSARRGVDGEVHVDRRKDGRDGQGMRGYRTSWQAAYRCCSSVSGPRRGRSSRASTCRASSLRWPPLYRRKQYCNGSPSRHGLRTALRRPRLSLCLVVWIDDIAGLVLLRPYDGNDGEVLERLQLVALDVMELHGDDKRLGQLPVWTELDVTDDGPERLRPHVTRELGIFEAFCCLDGLSQPLQLGVTPGSHVVTERVDTLRPGAGLISLDQLQYAGESHGGRRYPKVVVDDAVEERTKLPLEGGSL